MLLLVSLFWQDPMAMAAPDADHCAWGVAGLCRCSEGWEIQVSWLVNLCMRMLL